MRTLKKTLCLVLALVMVLGLCVTSVSAYDAEEVFTDYDQVKHEEAVQVLSMIGVVNGNGDGTLTPGKTLTRAEMAALIMQLMGGANGSYVAAPTFDDTVDAPAWVRKAIGFCQAQGIMTGYGDGTVGPYREVTGYEVASMMLRIIGYDMVQAKQDAGGDWTFATYKYVKQIDLDAGLTGTYETYEEYALGAPMPRDDAFQMVFNTLQATMVEYLPTTVSGLPTKVDSIGTRDYDKTNTDTNSFCEVVERYYPDLELDNGTVVPTTGRDEFMRPGHTWTYGKTNDSVFIIDTPIATYDGNFTGRDAKALGTRSNAIGDEGTLSVYYNGDATNVNSKWKEDNSIAGQAPNGLWLSDTAGFPGYEVEIYKVTGGYDVIVREAYLAKVTSVTAGQGKKDITLSVYEGGATLKTKDITVKAPSPMADGDDLYADLTGYAKNDYLAVYLVPGWYEDLVAAGPTTGEIKIEKLLEVASLTPVETKITRIDDKGAKVTSSVTAGGTKYGINNEAVLLTGSNPAPVVFTWGNTRNLTVGDATLYLLGSSILLIDQKKVATVDAGYAYLFDFKENSAGANDWQSEGGSDPGAGNWVRVLTTENEIRELKLSDSSPVAAAAIKTSLSDGSSTNYLGELVYYTYDSTDKAYKLTKIDGYDAAATTNELEITTNKSMAKVPDATTAMNVAFDSKTKFIVVTTENIKADGDPEAAPKKPNWAKTAAIYDVYNVPNFKTGNAYVTVAAPLGTDNALEGDSNDGVVTANGLAHVVLIKDAGSATTSGYYFVLSTGKEAKSKVVLDDGTIVEYSEFQAVVDGVLTSVNIEVQRWSNADVKDPSAGVAPTTSTVKFFKNPVIETYEGVEIITNLGTDLPNKTADESAFKGSALAGVKNDHFQVTLTGDGSFTSGDKEDFLVSKAVSVAFTYDMTKGLKQIELSDIADYEGGGDVYVIRNSTQTVVSALFIAEPRS